MKGKRSIIRSVKNLVPPVRMNYVCTSCGGDATVAYTCDEKRLTSWNGLVKRGERVCSKCFQKRGGKRLF